MPEVLLDKISRYTKRELYDLAKRTTMDKLALINQNRSYNKEVKKLDDEVASLQAWRIMLAFAVVAAYLIGRAF